MTLSGLDGIAQTMYPPPHRRYWIRLTMWITSFSVGVLAILPVRGESGQPPPQFPLTFAPLFKTPMSSKYLLFSPLLPGQCLAPPPPPPPLPPKCQSPYSKCMAAGCSEAIIGEFTLRNGVLDFPIELTSLTYTVFDALELAVENTLRLGPKNIR